MQKRWVWAVAAAFLLFVGAYAISPFWAARQLRVATVTGDTDSLEKLVDFPAVRDSLKSQLTVILNEKMNEDTNLKGNPLAGLGMMLMPTIINNMVDRFVTPDAISTMATQGKVAKENKPAGSNPKVTYEYGYRGLDRFGMVIKSEEAPTGRILTFVFDRRGLFTWRLVSIQMSPDLLKPAA
jgi:hypothetical protein